MSVSLAAPIPVTRSTRTDYADCCAMPSFNLIRKGILIRSLRLYQIDQDSGKSHGAVANQFIALP